MWRANQPDRPVRHPAPAEEVAESLPGWALKPAPEEDSCGDEADGTSNTRGGDFLATQAEYEGWGDPREHQHPLMSEGMRVVRSSHRLP